MTISGKLIHCISGPKEVTLSDFWRMIWEQNIEIIIMLTNCVENDKDKCFQYWPEQGSVQHGNIVVTALQTQQMGNYTTRQLLVEKV